MSPDIDTRSRILDAAEALFAEKGFAGTSIRSITAAADVNLAAAHYHFGSKEAVVREVFRRRIEPLNEDRRLRLERILGQAGCEAPRLEAVIEAFVDPALRLARNCRDSDLIMRLMGRAHTEPGEVVFGILQELFGDTVQRFHKALSLALPERSSEEIYWKLHFMIGTMAFSLASCRAITRISQGLCDPHDTDSLRARLIPFIAAGMRATPGSAS